MFLALGAFSLGDSGLRSATLPQFPSAGLYFTGGSLSVIPGCLYLGICLLAEYTVCCYETPPNPKGVQG